MALAWLPPAFIAWYLLAPVVLWPMELLVTLIARVGFGDLVQAVERHGATLTFLTSLQSGRAQAAGNISVDVDMLLYSFGLPLFAALTLAAREPGRLRSLVIGYAAMTPFVAWGVLADFLKNIAITSPALVSSQTGFSPLQREFIAFAFQFGSLILPSVVPAVAWVLLHRKFLERLRGTASP